MWPYVADIQRDFAARVAWAGTGSFAEGEHAPALSVREGLDFSAAPGAQLELHPQAQSRDNAPLRITARVYPEAGAPCSPETVLSLEGDTARITVPAEGKPGDRIHVIFKAQAEGRFRLVHYQQVIITVN